MLLGKFQTDKLEGRFGKYRLLSGSNFHVSVTQILESEKKLKILSLLKLKSSKYGVFSISQFALEDEKNISSDFNSFDVSPFLEILDKSDSVSVNNEEYNSLFFIAGYCTHSLIKYTKNCENCKKLVSSNEEFFVEFSDKKISISEYLIHLTRGALKTPSEFVFLFVIDCFKIFNLLLSEEYEKDFSDILQRSVLKNIFLMKTDYCNNNSECQSCRTSYQNILSKMAHILGNIFLNNYSKLASDRLKDLNQESTISKKNRKLKTFNK